MTFYDEDILNGDLTFYDEENIILSGVIDFFCLKTQQFFEASMLCGIINEMRTLSPLPPLRVTVHQMSKLIAEVESYYHQNSHFVN